MPWKMASRPSLVEMQTSLHMVRSSCSDLIIASRVVWREIHGYWIQLVLISVKDRLSNVISRVLTSQRTEGGETGRESEREREREREREIALSCYTFGGDSPEMQFRELPLAILAKMGST